jgi:hypothetical protein
LEQRRRSPLSAVNDPHGVSKPIHPECRPVKIVLNESYEQPMKNIFGAK